MTTVSQAAAPRPKLTPLRILAVAVAALIAPVIVVVQATGGADSDTVLAGAAAIVLFALVIIRMVGLARAQEETAELERTMRRASDALAPQPARRRSFKPPRKRPSCSPVEPRSRPSSESNSATPADGWSEQTREAARSCG